MSTAIETKDEIAAERSEMYSVMGNLFSDSGEHRYIQEIEDFIKKLIFTNDEKNIIEMIMSSTKLLFETSDSANKTIKFSSALKAYENKESVEGLAKLLDHFLILASSKDLPIDILEMINIDTNLSFGSLGKCFYLHCSIMNSLIHSTDQEYSLIKQKDYIEQYFHPWAELFGEFVFRHSDDSSVYNKLALLPELIIGADLYYISILLDSQQKRISYE